MADILRDGVPVQDREVVIQRPDGSRCTAVVNIRPLKELAGNIIGAVNCFHDITGQQAEQDYVLTRDLLARNHLECSEPCSSVNGATSATSAPKVRSKAAG